MCLCLGPHRDRISTHSPKTFNSVNSHVFTCGAVMDQWMVQSVHCDLSTTRISTIPNTSLKRIHSQTMNKLFLFSYLLSFFLNVNI